MEEWWNGLSLLAQIYATVAMTASVILVIQLLMLIFGLGGHSSGFEDHGGFDHSGIDHTIEHPETGVSPLNLFIGLKLFTFRGIVSFLAIGGWTGVTLLQTDINVFISIIISLLAGLLTAYLIALAFKGAMKLQSSGNIEMHNALGHTATVYIRIPKNRIASGKVTMILQGRFSEFDAMTDSKNDITAGQVVIVTDVLDSGILIVKRVSAQEKTEDKQPIMSGSQSK